MRILHTSDWHLGATDSDKSLKEDQQYFINQICDISHKEDVDVIVIAGDIYDRSIAPADAIELYDKAMTRFCIELGKEVVVIAGNHDSASRLSGCRELLEKSGLHIVGILEKKPYCVRYDDTEIYLFPWITEEKVKGLFPDKSNDIHNLTDAYRVVCNEARATFDSTKKHIAVAHAFVTNAELSGSDRAAQIAAIGNAMQIDADVFEGFDYVALGHIHRPQDINDKIRYCGTPMPYSFGKEEKQEKSVTIIDTATMEKRTVNLDLYHQRTTLVGTYEELLKGDYDNKIKEGYVRLQITDIHIGMEGISQLKTVYPNMLEVVSKPFEGEDSKIKMTIEEFNRYEDNPLEIFRSYCRDIRNEEPSEHMSQLFIECCKEDL